MNRFMLALLPLALDVGVGAAGCAKSAEREKPSAGFDSLYKHGQYDQAKAVAQKELETAEKKLGPDHPDVGTNLNRLAMAYQAQGQYAQAEPLYKRSLAIREKALGPDHPDVAQSLNNLAELYRTQGRYAQAEPLYKRSLAIW